MRRQALWLWAFMAVAHAQTVTPVDTPSFDLGANLRSACWKGDLPEVTRLINAGASIEGRDSLLRTPLFLACHGSPDIVKLLLAHGARVDVVDKDGDTTIGRACEYGDLESAKLVLAAGADMNRENKYGRTPLMLAAREGRDALVALLIANHVDVNHEGITSPALYYAAVQDHLSIVQMLLDAGAHVKRMPGLDPRNPDKEPILGKAAYVNDLPMIDVLLAHGADINEATHDSGRSVLMYAVQSAKPATIAYLLEKGADPNAQNSSGETPLMLAINYQPVSVLGDMLDHGARLEREDQRGRTAIMWAAHFHLFEWVRYLADSGASVNATDDNGETALTYAGDRGDAEIAGYLKDKGAMRTDLHIIERTAPNPPLTSAQSWALAVGAIYAQSNGGNFQVLGYDINETEPDEAMRVLKEDWGISDPTALQNEISLLGSIGQRTEYQKEGASLAALTEDGFAALLKQMQSDAREQAYFKAERSSYQRWKDRSGLAWDLCRRANLICCGYAAGLLSADKAWPLLLDNARQTQQGFSSWQEMSDNFLDAREIWAGSRDSRFEACARLLLNPKDPNSPWNRLPWTTSLAASGASSP